jgi:hypothetical protein
MRKLTQRRLRSVASVTAGARISSRILRTTSKPRPETCSASALIEREAKAHCFFVVWMDSMYAVRSRMRFSKTLGWLFRR